MDDSYQSQSEDIMHEKTDANSTQACVHNVQQAIPIINAPSQILPDVNAQLINYFKSQGYVFPQVASDIQSAIYISQALPDTLTQGQTTITRRKFSHEEDEMLKLLIQQMGTSNWKNIAQRMPNRSARQCRERWKNYLSPGLQIGVWSEEEDRLLEKLRNEMGPQWSIMTKFFPGRTDINIKNHWATLSNHLAKHRQILQYSTPTLVEQSPGPNDQQPTQNQIQNIQSTENSISPNSLK